MTPAHAAQAENTKDAAGRIIDNGCTICCSLFIMRGDAMLLEDLRRGIEVLGEKIVEVRDSL